MRYIMLFLTLLIMDMSYAQAPRYRSPNGISNKKNYRRNVEHPFFLTARCGLTQFYGELNAQAMHGMAGFGAGIWLNKELAVAFDYHAGTIGGEKSAFFHSYFENEYNTAELLVKWDLSEQFSSQEPGPAHFTLTAGIGQIWFSAQAFDLNDNRLLRFTNSPQSARNPLFLRWGPPRGPKGIRKTREGILPVGTSVDYALLKNLKIALEYRCYFVRTDKLDATSGHRLVNPEESDSYSNTPNDAFSFIALSVRYHFGRKRK